MINLISNEERQAVTKDFYFRMVAVFFFMLGLAMIVASIALVPSYFLVVVKENSANQKLDFLQRQPVPQVDQATTQTITDLNKELTLIEKSENGQFLVSQRVINEIVNKKMSDIKITELSYIKTKDKNKDTVMVNVRGIAPNRERLLLFRQTLEDDLFFSKVDLPISNFIKDSNIDFSLSLVPLKNDTK